MPQGPTGHDQRNRKLCAVDSNLVDARHPTRPPLPPSHMFPLLTAPHDHRTSTRDIMQTLKVVRLRRMEVQHGHRRLGSTQNAIAAATHSDAGYDAAHDDLASPIADATAQRDKARCAFIHGSLSHHPIHPTPAFTSSRSQHAPMHSSSTLCMQTPLTRTPLQPPDRGTVLRSHETAGP
ncbi:hypothetical protein JB92DRAFT_3127473 [Gautieria morchelliformis]|nr:hypothetical protein JB92DRAFT_3136512 [Gautieria morchelliformis]KAF8493320.1 hypothetical protein JB92DRAFT_3127473 [Gautieria morchelliformis]